MFGGDAAGDFEALAKLLADCERADGQAAPSASRGSALGGPAPPPRATELLDVRVATPTGRAAAGGPAGERDGTAGSSGRARKEDDSDAEADDARAVPSHEILYRQPVCSGDAFLGLSDLPGEQLLVRVWLPGGQRGAAGLRLRVRPTSLALSSSLYRLRLPLPHRVDDERGRATWDEAKRTLSVALPIVREDPF